jgi:hypothetical protein|uniref:Uncharacterized protein n=1 Tax=Siphoviridae sp. ctHip2 TaxID=2827830 RepID=A0A8S5RV63_9CAUD|nr:MAG TPA: hypothetical protein [Siphoviridae sp. ctHip2]
MYDLYFIIKISACQEKILIFLTKINGIIKLRKSKNKKGVIPLKRNSGK